ncbi:sensor histidine kinase [Inquilinus sp. Marseille-Q2685]|uniref:sensor histidine kinase n=1 Tax=Inquilinus sp. Marseille-Q2685 TaxID=2866581 RepID=UPI001CE3CC5C|nr:ATP-binding protein [Inquilinus sp. Marseille-Q2685]
MTAAPAAEAGFRPGLTTWPGPGWVLPLLTAALALAIFLFDTFSPMKIAVAVLYAIVILMSVGFLDRRGVLLTAFGCGGLTVIGFLVGLRHTGFEAHLLRGVVSLSAIGIATALAHRSQTAMAVLRDNERRWSGIIIERALAERALAEARAELAHVSRVVTLGELTASIAHEVKQPLAAIVTDAQACLRWLDRPVPALDEARACAGRIAGQAVRADHVVQRLRDLTRKAPPEPAAVDLGAAIGEVVELTRREIADHRVTLHTRLAPGLPPVSADRIQLQQVLINLVVNAVQAMEAAPRRELAIETGVGPAGEVLILVADSGIGLGPEEMARLFTPFHTTKPGGMGLGLSICRSIVEAHGGRIWASRNADAGLTFHVALPAAGRTA